VFLSLPFVGRKFLLPKENAFVKIKAKLKQNTQAAKKSRIILYFYSIVPIPSSLCT